MYPRRSRSRWRIECACTGAGGSVVAPQTFNEKILSKMVWDRRPILVTCADKVAAADHIARQSGPGCTLNDIW